MPKINILSPFVADLIAAGEVVERPASVVKELIENSMDAGARSITVEIRSGGMEYIRVSDDGCGMAPEDAGVAFLRHATSKLQDERGLEAIGTLGFRGEALAAIGSVSHIELLTRERSSDSGTRLLLEGGEIADMAACGCPEGTTMIVRGLFYNTPARLKFMKSDRSEGASCSAAALRCALGHPELSVRCIRDGREEFFTPGDGRAESCVYNLLGREAAGSLLPLRLEDGAISVSGFVSSPAEGRGNRSRQYFFCNGRNIRSQLLQSAVEQAYKNTLLTGRFPACVLYITLSPGSVDVNVHPAKTEVKFSDEKSVFDAVHYAARGALERETLLAGATTSGQIPAVSSAPRPAPQNYYAAAQPREAKRGVLLHEPAAYYQARIDLPHTAIPAQPASAAPINTAPYTPPQADTAEDEAPLRVIGEALSLYILVEKGEKLILIDKHAAHERMLFDRLRKSGGEAMSQTLLEPVPLNVSDDDAQLLAQNASLFYELGFEVEPYGEAAFIIRSAPCGMQPADARSAIEDILSSLSGSLRPDPLSLRDEALKTVACKAAIKAGRRSEPAELQKLAEAVCSGEVRYCPHGRPVAWTLTRSDLDREFKRII